MVLEQLNPLVRYAKTHYTYEKHKNFHMNYDCRLFYVTKGSGTFIANGQTYSINPNMVIFFPTATKYNFFFNEKNVEFCVLNFDLVDDFYEQKKSLGAASEDNFNWDKCPKYEIAEEFQNIIIQKNGSNICKSIWNVTEQFLRQENYYRFNSSAIVKTILLDLLTSSQSQGSSYQIAQKVIDYIISRLQIVLRD
jgi:hypothetical protein